ncbi:hypothetical protein [Legionella brunensis]|uniref:Transmembrane protein n=1 Tax=Legionella brunensis TaxID=29422 RepID=A0A0W0SLN1_9GAMM|nr:hypothetical protein [Legionella brunensis]KTC84220.1 hypothetical protein Lbru_1581 [Legionella brunensis]
MHSFFRTILLVVVWISLLIVPYALISYLCYAGLCGGAAAAEIRSHPFYVNIWSYYIWLYPLIVFGALYACRQLPKDSMGSLIVLLIPLLCLMPLGYFNYQINKISTKYSQQEANYYSFHADDFACSPGKFIRYESGHFSFFEGKSGPYGSSWTVSYFEKYKELEAFAKTNNIDILQCKNQKGVSLDFKNQ